MPATMRTIAVTASAPQTSPTAICTNPRGVKLTVAPRSVPTRALSALPPRSAVVPALEPDAALDGAAGGGPVGTGSFMATGLRNRLDREGQAGGVYRLFARGRAPMAQRPPLLP